MTPGVQPAGDSGHSTSGQGACFLELTGSDCPPRGITSRQLEGGIASVHPGLSTLPQSLPCASDVPCGPPGTWHGSHAVNFIIPVADLWLPIEVNLMVGR